MPINSQDPIMDMWCLASQITNKISLSLAFVGTVYYGVLAIPDYLFAGYNACNGV